MEFQFHKHLFCNELRTKSIVLNFWLLHTLQSLWKSPKNVSLEFVTFNFLADQSMTFGLFCAVKTMLSKLENLWYLLSKKVSSDAQHWLHNTKKVKSYRLISKRKINVARFARNVSIFVFSLVLPVVPQCLKTILKSHFIMRAKRATFII